MHTMLYQKVYNIMAASNILTCENSDENPEKFKINEIPSYSHIILPSKPFIVYVKPECDYIRLLSHKHFILLLNHILKSQDYLQFRTSSIYSSCDIKTNVYDEFAIYDGKLILKAKKDVDYEVRCGIIQMRAVFIENYIKNGVEFDNINIQMYDDDTIEIVLMIHTTLTSLGITKFDFEKFCIKNEITTKTLQEIILDKYFLQFEIFYPF
jgi:hypothetical protein